MRGMPRRCAARPRLQVRRLAGSPRPIRILMKSRPPRLDSLPRTRWSGRDELPGSRVIRLLSRTACARRERMLEQQHVRRSLIERQKRGRRMLVRQPESRFRSAGSSRRVHGHRGRMLYFALGCRVNPPAAQGTPANGICVKTCKSAEEETQGSCAAGKTYVRRSVEKSGNYGGDDGDGGKAGGADGRDVRRAHRAVGARSVKAIGSAQERASASGGKTRGHRR